MSILKASKNNQLINDEFEQRLSHLEANVNNLSITVGKHTEAVENQFRALNSRLDQNAERGRITWPLVFAAIGAIVGLLGIVATVGTLALTPLKFGVVENYKAVTNHKETDGHPALSQQVSNNTKAIKDQDETLQKEMTILHQEQDAKLNALETNIKSEVGLSVKILSEKIATNRS